MSIRDIVKNSILEEFNRAEMSSWNMLVCLAGAALLGIFIYLVYRMITANTFYSKTFNLSLMLLCVITAAIILTVQNSVIVSLGMVGALSIVRFRTAVKEPLDLVFLFWSISVGIISGAGMIELAVFLSGIVTVLMFLFYHMPEQRKSMLLSVNAEGYDTAKEVLATVKKYDKHCGEKSRNMAQGRLDMLLEIRLKNYEDLLKELNEVKGVQGVSLIAHKGDTVY